MRYEEPRPISQADAESSFRGTDIEAICRDLVRAAYYVPDWEWLETWCLQFARSGNVEVQQVAATCLGHIARIHRVVHTDRVVPVLRKMMAEPLLAGAAADALGDVEHYATTEEEA